MSKIVHLSNRSVLSLEGSDSLRFLQSLITNDVNHVTDTAFTYSFMLSPQGKFLYDFFIIRGEGDSQVLIDCQSSYCDEILTKFNMYKLRSDVTILKQADLKVYASFDDIRKDRPGFIDPRCKNLGFRIITHSIYPNTITMDGYTYQRIKCLVPDGDEDFTYNRSLILEYDALRLNGVSFTKGCYVGQEVVSRMNYRLNVRKKLYLIKFNSQTDEMPPKGSDFELNGKIIGTFLSHSRDLALGLLVIDEAAALLTQTKVPLEKYGNITILN